MITYGSTTLTSYNSIVRTEVYYYKSTSATSLSGGSWSTTKPTWENGKYIWQKIRTVYEDGTHSESDPVNITGQQGATGTAAYSYKLNSSDSIIGKTKDGEYTIKKITFSATCKQGTGAVSAYGGRFKIESTTNGSTWKTEYTSSGNESSKEFTIPDDIILIKCSLYQSDGTTVLLDIVTVPVVKDGVDAIGLRDSIPYYLASDKDTDITRLTQGWTRYRPQLTAEKKYLWVYYVSRYSEGSTEPELIEIKDDLVHFVNNGDESPVESCVVDIEPVQDLHGYDSPWPAGGGVNLFDIDNIKKVSGAYGLTTSIDGDVVRISGTYTGTTNGSSHRIIYHDQPITEDAKFAVFRLDTSSVNASLRYASTSDNSIVLRLYNIATNTDVDIRFRFVLYTGSTVPTSYTPYSNICPITGWTGAKVTRCGKNLVPRFLSEEKTAYGLTLTPNEDGSIRIHGTPTNGESAVLLSRKVFTQGDVVFPAGRYTVNRGSYSVNNTIYIQVVSYKGKVMYTRNIAVAYTHTEDFLLRYCDIGINPSDGTPIDVTIYPQIELGSTATDYEPYSGQTYSITFPTEAGTVYGGQLNVTTGELTVDRAMVTLDGSNNESIVNTSRENANTAVWGGYESIGTAGVTFISDKLKSKAPQSSTVATGLWEVWCSASAPRMWFSVPKTLTTHTELRAYLAENPITVVYPLATPITYTLAPQEITMLCKENNIFADTGQTAISYYDNQTSTDPYVDYSLTSAFDASTDALDKAKEVAQDLADLGADLQAQIDGKIETWCQSTDPSTAWTTTELKNQHNGDLWYYTGESTSSYKNNTTYKYTASTNKWTAYSASTDLFDKIDAKTSIYYGKPSAVTQNLEVGDYLVDSTDGCSYRWDGSKWVKLTDYKVAIDAIEIGGRNLLLNSATEKTGASNVAQWMQWAISDSPLVANEEYMFSFDAKMSNNTDVFYIGFALNSNTQEIMKQEVLVTDTYKRYTYKVKTTKTNINSIIISNAKNYGHGNANNSTGVLNIKNIKLEKGNKATKWTPAPEDIETELTTIKNNLQSQIDEKIQTYYQSTNPASAWTTADIRATHDGDLWCYTGATTSTYTKDNVYRYNASNNTWTTYSASGDLFDKVDGKTTVFYGKTTDTFTDVETGDYLVDATDGSSYRYDGSKWVKVTDYQAAIDKIEVGGRNYKRNSNFKDQLNKWNIWAGATVTIDENIENKNWAHVTMGTDKTYGGFNWELGKKTTADPMQIVSGEEITISFDAQLIEGEGNAVVWLHYKSTESGANLSQALQRFPLTEAITRFSHTFTVPTHSTYTVDTINVMIGIIDGTIKQGRFTNIKVEKGNRSTDWTPAPEDIDASITTAQTTADEALAATQPISSKTFTDIIGTANDIANASFYFAKVHPTTYTDPWMVKMKIKASVPSDTNFRKTVDITIHGCRSNFISYDSIVANYNSNPIYYLNLYRATQAGIETNKKGHALGFGLRSSTSPIDTDKKRTFEVDLLEVDGCTVDWIDTPVKYADMDGTGSTNYVGCTELGITSNGQNATNNDNTYDRIKYSTIKAAEAIARYNIIVGTSAGYKHLKSGTPWDITYPILYADAALNANATGSSNYLTIPFTVTTTQNMTLTPYKPVYIEGTLEGTTFTPIDTTPLTQTVPTSDNGHQYILLGSAYSTTAINLEAEHPIYQFQNGNFVTVAEAASRIGANAENLLKATYAVCSTAAGTNTKTADCTNFELYEGVRIQVTFTNANTAEAPTLNIHNTGARAIYINKTVTSDTNLLLWTAGSKMEFVYDGTGWIAQNVPYALYGTCSTSASTAAKDVTCNEAVICKGTTISVNMTNTNTAADATMNVGSTVAKDIYANGAKLTTNSRFNWRANTTQKFVFDGQVWRMDDDSVKALATAYITEIDDDGIMVHPEDDDTSGWAISDAIQLFKNGISYIKLWIENNIPKIRIGKEDQGHIILDNDSVDIRNDDKVLASFGATSVIGDENDWHQTIAANQITFAKGNNTITYISPDKLYTINAEVADAFYISNYSIRNASDGKLVIGLRR